MLGLAVAFSFVNNCDVQASQNNHRNNQRIVHEMNVICLRASRNS